MTVNGVMTVIMCFYLFMLRLQESGISVRLAACDFFGNYGINEHYPSGICWTGFADNCTEALMMNDDGEGNTREYSHL